ncbi:glycosyltransferase family 4 protein [Nisaea sediminum]|uniref:glycosyltransferase family 4 protein n=1 Tax=Nisaea sediminum TaxID=2775867 RepID=UPI001868EF73|nr:glycosyltransferase family 4 protein [Nisaea sediminum]
MSKILRILATCHRLDYSGAPLLLFRLLEALAERHDITVLGPEGDTVEKALVLDYEKAGIRVVSSATPRDFDLLLANTLYGGHHIVQMGGKIPSVLWVHEPTAGRRGIEQGIFLADGIRLADSVVFPTRWQAEELYAPYLGTREFEVIPYGIKARVDRRERPFSLPPNTTTLLQLGWIDPRKGQHLTAAALDYLNDPNIHVFMAGSDSVNPDFAARLKMRVTEEKHIANQVHFLGVLGPDEVDAYLAHVDALVFPTNDDLITVSILEAMARKTCVISSDFGPIPETVIDGETGLLFPVGDINAYMECIRRVASDSALRDKLASGGYEIYARKHGFKTHVKAMEQTLLKTAGRTSA